MPGDRIQMVLGQSATTGMQLNHPLFKLSLLVQFSLFLDLVCKI